MDMGLHGRNAIVLGGSRGIGWYTAAELAREGCRIAFCGRAQDSLERAVERLEAVDPDVEVHAAVADLSDGDATRGFVADSIDALGGVDLLIHNASGFDMAGDEPGWRASFDVDMMAGVRAVEVAEPALAASDAASITFVGSRSSSFYFGLRSSYGPAKAAMRAYANELAQSLGHKGIRANAVSPGAVWFPGGVWDRRKQADPEAYAKVERSIPLGRLGTAEEIARIIVFVASPAGRWINGTHIAADGGQVATVD